MKKADLDRAVLNVKEYIDLYQESPSQVSWRTRRRIGDVSWNEKKKEIRFHRGETPGYWYPPLYLYEVNDHQGMLHWLCHLHGKAWFTPTMMHDFVSVWREVASVNEYCRYGFQGST